MITLKLIAKFIKLLNKEASPSALAGGVAFGALMGLTPKGALHNLCVLVLVLMLRVNLSVTIFFTAIFAGFAYLLDPLFNRLGYSLLVNVPALEPFWIKFYNTPVLPWFKFNNTLVLGSLVFSLVLFVPLFVAVNWMVKKYRVTFLTKIDQWKIVKVLKASKLYGLYARFAGE